MPAPTLACECANPAPRDYVRTEQEVRQGGPRAYLFHEPSGANYTYTVYRPVWRCTACGKLVFGVWAR